MLSLEIPEEFEKWIYKNQPYHSGDTVMENLCFEDGFRTGAIEAFRYLVAGYGWKKALSPSGHPDPLINSIIRDGQQLEKERDDYRHYLEELNKKVIVMDAKNLRDLLNKYPPQPLI
jgi:hypothetical protein